MQLDLRHAINEQLFLNFSKVPALASERRLPNQRHIIDSFGTQTAISYALLNGIIWTLKPQRNSLSSSTVGSGKANLCLVGSLSETLTTCCGLERALGSDRRPARGRRTVRQCVIAANDRSEWRGVDVVEDVLPPQRSARVVPPLRLEMRESNRSVPIVLGCIQTVYEHGEENCTSCRPFESGGIDEV